MHGVGTFESPDGTRYQGGWAHDLKQGLGKKWFPNGDTYEVTKFALEMHSPCLSKGYRQTTKPDSFVAAKHGLCFLCTQLCRQLEAWGTKRP